MAKKKTAKKPKGMTDQEKLNLEREIRRYVKKSGGYRKNLPEKDKVKCAELLRKLNAGTGKVRTPDDPWDITIVVPGVDNPSVGSLTWTK